MKTLFDLQRAAFAKDSFPDLAVRLDRLARLKALMVEHEEAMAQAISADFGQRSRHETLIAESFIVLSDIGHTQKHLKRWMKPRRVATALHFLPGSSRIIPQPLGVVGIISPWNYPLQLAIVPTVAALAAGNRVMIKPSELTPRFSDLLGEILAQRFANDECAVVTGDAEIARAFSALPFDHLFFTGSTAVGRHVGVAAAANLTPVTLELGGKSPTIVGADADLAKVAKKLAAGKLLNAGQTCIAPDYVLLPRASLAPFATAYAQAVSQLYPTLEANPDYTSIVNGRHFARITGLVDDARAKGAQVVEINPANEAAAPGSRKLRPTLLLEVNDGMSAMQEEIFGPVLPLLGYDTLDDAIAYVNAHPRPLALYYFGNNRGDTDRVLHETISGGVTINDALLHIVQANLPFGGVGPSGSGAYHGDYGFKLFTKEKPVFIQSRLSGSSLLFPPYGKFTETMLGWMKKIV
ncbi:MAG: coniferyl aldehyde dehydrogenase [Betaproteobacteria bacterium]